MILSHKNLVLEHAIVWNVRSQTCLQKTTNVISETSFNVGAMRVLIMTNSVRWVDGCFYDFMRPREQREIDPAGQMFIIRKLTKNKWEAKYPDGSTKQFRTLKAARAYGIPKQFCQP